MTKKKNKTLLDIINLDDQENIIPEIIDDMESKETYLDKILAWFSEDEFLKADGFDEAIIGIDEATMRLIYSKSKCIEILMSEGLDEEDALEHFSYNIQGAYVGEKTPIWCLDDL